MSESLSELFFVLKTLEAKQLGANGLSGVRFTRIVHLVRVVIQVIVVHEE